MPATDPLDPYGNSDPKKGIREFIVGTGGETLDPVVTAPSRRPQTGDANFNATESRGGIPGTTGV